MKTSVTLNPGESKTVTFNYTPAVAKGYSVNVDGLAGSFVASEVPVATFEVSNLIIYPTEVYVGEAVSISVTVTNVGGLTGTYEVNCEVL